MFSPGLPLNLLGKSRGQLMASGQIRTTWLNSGALQPGGIGQVTRSFSALVFSSGKCSGHGAWAHHETHAFAVSWL